MSESDRKRFGALDATDKQKVANVISKAPTTDSKVLVKLWENVVAPPKEEEPLWLTMAPEAYRQAYNNAPKEVKESIQAKTDYFTLNTTYQIEHFWETSGIIQRPVITLNESVYAKTPEESDQKFDSFVAGVGEAMKRYNVE